MIADRTKRRGATIVEAAFVLLICLILMLAIFEYGRFLMVRQMVDNAAREGARHAAAGTSAYSTAQIQGITLNYLVDQPLLNESGQPLAAKDVKVYRANPITAQPATPDSTWTSAAFGESIAVRVEAVYRPMLPTFGFLPTNVPVEATVMMQSEAN